MTFLSVLLAIGLAEVLSGWGRLIRTPEKEQLYPLFVFWSLTLIPQAVVTWAQLWGYQVVNFLEGYKVLLLAVPTLCYVIVAFLLTPVSRVGDAEPMEATYWRLAPFVFTLLMAMNVLGVAVAWIVSGVGFDDPGAELLWRITAGAVPIGLLQFSLAFVKRPLYHWVIGILTNTVVMLQFLTSSVLFDPTSLLS